MHSEIDPHYDPTALDAGPVGPCSARDLPLGPSSTISPEAHYPPTRESALKQGAARQCSGRVLFYTPNNLQAIDIMRGSRWWRAILRRC